MRRATIKEYDALAERLTNLVGIMDHRFKNLCIKADPVALLPVQVLVEGELQNLEQCAVIGKENDGAWCLRINLFLVAVEVNEILSRIAPYQVVVRAAMGNKCVHRDDGIEQNLEVGTHIFGCTGCNC